MRIVVPTACGKVEGVKGSLVVAEGKILGEATVYNKLQELK